MQFVQGQILKQTVLAALMAALSPVVWLKITKVIGEPLEFPPASVRTHALYHLKTIHG